MKVLLVIPPVTTQERYGKLSDVGTLYPPLGLAYIAAVTEQSGHEVKVIDSEAMNYGYKEIMDIVRRFNPSVVGMQTFSTNIPRCHDMAKKLKEFNPEIKIVLGGAQVTVMPEYSMKEKEIDFIVYGEGERTFKQLLEALERNTDLLKVKGIYWKKNNHIIKNESQELIKNLDEVPMPARHLFPMQKYHSSAQLRGKRTLNIMTSRGCPFRCAYCSGHLTFGKTHRFHSTQRVLDEIEIMIETYGCDGIQFYDETLTANKNRVNELCDEIIKRKLKFEWSCFTRVNLVDQELLYKMKKAGCYQIFYGTESGVQELLNRIRKDITLEQSKKAIEMTKKAGIESWCSFMLALPGETKEQSLQTIKFALELDPEYILFPITTPYPGTALHDIAKEHGRFIEDDWTKYMIWDKVVYLPNGRTEKDIRNTVKLAYRKFYLRPSYMLRRAKSFAKLPPSKVLKLVRAGLVTIFRS